MTRRRRAAILVALAVVLSARSAGSDPAPAPAPAPPAAEATVPDPAPELPPTLHFSRPATLTSASGRIVLVPPGYYLPDPVYDALDLELRRAQDAETRLAAENESLRRSASATPGGKLLVGVAVVALAVGIGIGAGAFR